MHILGICSVVLWLYTDPLAVLILVSSPAHTYWAVSKVLLTQLGRCRLYLCYLAHLVHGSIQGLSLAQDGSTQPKIGQTCIQIGLGGGRLRAAKRLWIFIIRDSTGAELPSLQQLSHQTLCLWQGKEALGQSHCEAFPQAGKWLDAQTQENSLPPEALLHASAPMPRDANRSQCLLCQDAAGAGRFLRQLVALDFDLWFAASKHMATQNTRSKWENWWFQERLVSRFELGKFGGGVIGLSQVHCLLERCYCTQKARHLLYTTRVPKTA